MRVKVKRLSDNAKLPEKSHNSDSGLDLTATSKDFDGKNFVYGTGIAIEVEEGYETYVYPRSSLSKKDLILANSVGVIDQNYRGEITLKFRHTTESRPNVYNVGDKIGQLVFKKRLDVDLIEVSELSDTDRGAGGYGSTGE